MKLLLQCAIAAFILLAVSALVAVLGFNVAFAAIGWPGLIVANAVLARFGFYMRGSESMWLWLVPGAFIDFVAYTIFFFLLAKLRRALLPRPEGGRSASRRG
jgi:hypothetical protein